MPNKILVFEECMEKFAFLSEMCMRIHSLLKDPDLDCDISEKAKRDLAEMSEKCEFYANLFDAYKRRLEEKTTMNCVYASPDIMSGRPLK